MVIIYRDKKVVRCLCGVYGPSPTVLKVVGVFVPRFRAPLHLARRFSRELL
jgi:hypothetical protein